MTPLSNESQHLGIFLAGGPYLFCGLTPEQAAQTFALFGDLCRPLDPLDYPDAPQVTLTQAPEPYENDQNGLSWPTPHQILVQRRHLIARIDLQPRIRGQALVTLPEGQYPGRFSRAVIDNLLRHLVAYRLHAVGGLLLHCGCVLDPRGAHVFLGKSEAGKSTASALCRAAGYRILSDDLNILLPTPEGPRISPFPFAGNYFERENLEYSGVVRGFYVLRQSSRTALLPGAAALAYGQLLINAWYLNEDPHRHAALDAILSRLVPAIPAHVLEFRLDSDVAALLQ
jgi:hypothetical protein